MRENRAFWVNKKQSLSEEMRTFFQSWESFFFLGSEQFERGNHWRGDSENREEKKLREKVREGGIEVYYEVQRAETDGLAGSLVSLALEQDTKRLKLSKTLLEKNFPRYECNRFIS